MKTRKAADIMSSPVVTVRGAMRLTQAIDLLLRWNVSALPVVDDDQRLLGILTEYDIMNFAFSGDAADTRVEEAMTRDVVTFPPETDLETLVNCCAQKRMHRVPITRDGRVVGMVSRRDILREMSRVYSGF